MKGWQWLAVVLLALASGAIGGLMAGGVKVYVNDESPHYIVNNDRPPRASE